MRIVVMMLLGIFLYASDATLEIVKSADNRPSIVIQDASVFGTEMTRQKFFRLVMGDLKVTAHFKVEDTYHRAEYDAMIDPMLKSYNYLLRYRFREGDQQRLYMDVRAFELPSGRAFYERSYRVANRARYPFLIHEAVIDFNDFLKMPSVRWMKRYVVFSEYVKPKRADIVIADYTLTYRKRLVSGGLNIFPKWADRGQKGIYFTKLGRRPVLYYYNIYTGEERKVATSDGMLVCSDVSRDGKRLLLTMAPGGQPDIYQYHLDTGMKERLTFYSGIDVSAQYIDGEKRIVFVSDRLGYPNIFASKIGSRGVQQMVFHGRNNNACSAHGKYIVYSSRETDNAFSSNTFNLYLISTQTDYIRRLTASGVNQFPKFSDDGESVIYLKHYASQSAIGIIRLNYNEGYLFPLKGRKIQSIDW
ncbi:Tol-Pal system protein TolB [Hydrogenimonas urashimensis]|uniref:Tol-Pal system protein TolB n=1 Tax=Hydrogenimonas urashimensis TaxID=2740515 RepID=UPI001916AAEF|nr:Tol-Pal system protein TolB [Hydrogenimonas urashimensis]